MNKAIVGVLVLIGAVVLVSCEEKKETVEEKKNICFDWYDDETYRTGRR